MEINDIRTGLGYDLHRLVEGKKLMIGGVEIEFDKGELGHSDGDALLHAITDSLLGASHLGDIGLLFPPGDPKWKDADSSMLLKTAWELVKKEGYSIQNIDCVILMEKPKLLPYRNAICEKIASTLDISIDRVFVKAKTGEGLSDIGKGLAIECYATCLLIK